MHYLIRTEKYKSGMRTADSALRFIGALFACLGLFCGCSQKNADLAADGIKLPLAESMVRDISLNSRHTGKTMRCKVYLPSGYGGGEDYPVWYGLNGYGSNENMWIQAGLTKSADELIAQGEIPPLILVFPYTQNTTMKELSEDMRDDGKLGERNMDRFICEELIPFVDTRFDTRRSKGSRYIGGFSMGGMIALRIAFHHTDMFGKVSGFSPAVAYSDFSGLQLETWLYPNDDANGIADVYAYDKKKGLSGVRVYLDAGNSNDPFFEAVGSLYEALVKRGIAAEYHPYDGGHSLDHNRGDFGDYLRFITSSE